VAPQLDAWRRSRDALPGTDAGNPLDQALGDLKRLGGGEATADVQLVESLLSELPTPWEQSNPVIRNCGGQRI
jgi:hypothetical protein